MRPVILIPGVMGTSLLDLYPLATREVWNTWLAAENIIFPASFEALALDEEGVIDDTSRSYVVPGQVLGLAYGPLLEGLRTRLSVPVFAFQYDWRRSIASASESLMEYIFRLSEKSFRDVPDWDFKFDFVCHSMGGMVLRHFARTHGGRAIGRVVFIGTPHLGSLDAAEMLIRGESPLLGGRKEMRKLIRRFPSSYELLPRFPTAVLDGRTMESLDPFEISTWQSNVVGDGDYQITKHHLDQARRVLTNLEVTYSPNEGILLEDMLCIVGVAQESTLRTVAVIEYESEPNWWNFQNAGYSVGDGTVPAVSARLPLVQYIDINYEDVSYFTLARTISLHSFLPILDETQTIVARFLAGCKGINILPRGMPANRYNSV